MPLTDDIAAIRDRTVAELNAAHDYHTDTKIAWQLVERLIVGGEKFQVQNKTTGTVTTEADLAGKVRGYVAERLAETTFQSFLAVFEAFLGDLTKAWLLAYPQNLTAKGVKFQTVLAAADKNAVIEAVVTRAVYRLLYKRPTDWFNYLEKKLKLGCPSPDEIGRFAEAKARRDALIHNRGMVTAVYTSKSGKFAQFKPGDRVDVPEHYHRETWELLRKIVADLSAAMIAKFP